MSKKDSSENIEPQFRSTFNPIVDEAGFLVTRMTLFVKKSLKSP